MLYKLKETCGVYLFRFYLNLTLYFSSIRRDVDGEGIHMEYLADSVNERYFYSYNRFIFFYIFWTRVPTYMQCVRGEKNLTLRKKAAGNKLTPCTHAC